MDLWVRVQPGLQSSRTAGTEKFCLRKTNKGLKRWLSGLRPCTPFSEDPVQFLAYKLGGPQTPGTPVLRHLTLFGLPVSHLGT